jgi:hypothetical protein
LQAQLLVTITATCKYLQPCSLNTRSSFVCSRAALVAKKPAKGGKRNTASKSTESEKVGVTAADDQVASEAPVPENLSGSGTTDENE